MLLLLIPMISSFGQRTITGTVIDAENNEPLPGASVIIKGTTSGTITDARGAFTINAEQGDVLQVSFVGYRTREIAVENQQNVQVSMEFDRMGLEDVVVVGYGTQRTQDLTSAIVTIDNEELSKTPTSQAMQALQGKVAGVQVVSSGAPGSSPTVRIRGVGSLPGFGNSDPLYVVDGMFFDNIDFLNTSDIASISVLKDASAAAIYGVRAANGVVLIETTSGQYNQETEVVYNGYYGMQVAQNVLEMADTELFTQYIRETGDNADISFIQNSIDRYGSNPNNPNLPAVDTDWYDEVLRNGPMQNHSLSINGGSNNIKYSIGANYFNQKGLLNVIKNEYERTNFRTKIDFKATDRMILAGM